MDMNKLLRYVKRKCGLKHFEIGWDDEDFVEVIEEDALELFSMYVKPFTKIPIEIKTTNLIPGRENAYRIPIKSYLSKDIHIMDIKDVEEVYDTFDEIYHHKYYSGYEDMIDGVIDTTLDSFGTERLRFHFEAPNILVIENAKADYIDEEINFFFYTNMPKNLSQIPPQMEQTFKELAVIEVKDALFNEFEPIKSLNTPNGQIQLPIDKWMGMEERRKEIEEQLKRDRIENEFYIHIM